MILEIPISNETERYLRHAMEKYPSMTMVDLARAAIEEYMLEYAKDAGCLVGMRKPRKSA